MAGNVTRRLAGPFVSLSTMPSGFPRPTPLRMLFHKLCYRKKFIILQHSGGGADGSIMIFKDTELNYVANAGFGDIVPALEKILVKYHSSTNTHVNVSPGDMCVLDHSLAMHF
jgi:hypothetical protein